MADTAISALTEITTPASSDPMPVVNGGSTKKVTLANIVKYGRPLRGIECQVVADATDADTTSGVFYFRIPSAIDGMNLVRAQAYVITAGTTNATTVQVRNMTKYSSNDSLSTAISIASAATIGTAGTVNATYDDVSTDDLIKVYITANSTTKPKGFGFVLEYQLP